MPTNIRPDRPRPRVSLGTLLLAFTLLLGLTGCGDSGGAYGNPPAGVAGVGGHTAVVLLDTSGSVLAQTDLPAAAQNRVADLVQRMPVDGTVVVKGTNNVTANCTDLTFTLPAQPNATLLDQARQGNLQSVTALFPEYLDCVTAADQGGTQLFGLLAETAAAYPGATTWDVYTDGLDNYDLKGLRKAKRLRDPAFAEKALAELPPALTPQLTPGTTITWHALGRGSNLTAADLAGLRGLYLAWTAATGATGVTAPN